MLAAQSTMPRFQPTPAHLFKTNWIVSFTFWIAVQIAAVWIAHGSGRLTSSWPAEPRAAALNLLAATQIIAIGLLFSSLVTNLSAMLLLAVSAAPFVALAGRISDAPPTNWLILFGFVVAWMVAVWPWAVLARRTRCETISIAVSGLFVVGVPLCMYLAAEFASHWSEMTAWHPVFAVAGENSLHLPPPLGWVGVMSICVAGAGLERLERFINPQQTGK
jgi:hypothetical protein